MRFTSSLFIAPCIVVLCFALVTSPVQATTYIHKTSSVGKDFYLVFPHAAYGDQYLEALVNSPAKQRIHIMPAGQLGGGGYKNIPSNNYQDIEGGIFHQEKTSEVIDVKGAARITTQYPVSVIGQFGIPGISGTYNALPVSAWGTEYVVLDEPEGQNSSYSFYYPQVYSVPQVTIIASQNNTNIRITPTTRTAMNKPADSTFTITLNAGDVYYFTDGADPKAVDRVEYQCESPYGDFTGTRIVADPGKPIGVIVSQSHASEPCGDDECGDFGMEWLPPVANWDTEYVIAPAIEHGGAVPGQGEILRLVCAYPNTTLWEITTGGRDSIGIFPADTPIYIGNSILTPYVMTADHPFLVDEITTKPASCLVGNRGGGANFTFSMCFLPGVNQWVDFMPLATADQSSGSVAHLFFRQRDSTNIFLDGMSLANSGVKINNVPGSPFAYTTFSIGPDQYSEVRCINGATVGGDVFGYCNTQFSANSGNGSKHTLNPEMNKSFGHPLCINALPLWSPDTTPPYVALHYDCGTWFPDTAWDNDPSGTATGLYDVYLAENSSTGVFPPDSSYNVAFNPPPAFTIGTTSGVSFGIDVQNLADTAVAALRLRDGAGNEYDTILVYIPPRLLAAPASINTGAVTEGDSAIRFVVLTDSGNEPTVFTTFHLAIGKHWKILHSPAIPFTIQPGVSDTIYFEYKAPLATTFECDPDTLIVNSCRQFPLVSMMGCTNKPAIYASDYDFGCYTIDTLGAGGDTAYSPQTNRGVYFTNVGLNTLHVTGDMLTAVSPPYPYDPSADFTIMKYYDKTGAAVTPPFTLPPGDTVFVIVRGHPEQSGDIFAKILYTDDANHYVRDTSVLHICGLLPSFVPQDETAITPDIILSQNYPNPFSSATTFSFTAQENREYRVEIYNALGARIASLPASEVQPGKYAAAWNASGWASGVYYYRVSVGANDNFSGESKSFLLLR